MPQAGVLSLLPAPSAEVLAPCATPPHLQPATDLLNLPDDLLFRLPRFLRTANTIPEIRNVARFRAACSALYLGITQPIPDGMMGLIEFNRLEELELMLVQLEQSGKNVAMEVNRHGDLMKIRDPVLKRALPLVASAYLGHAGMAVVLIHAGASVDRSNTDYSALMYASQNGHAATVQVLLQADAWVDCADRIGCCALILAAERGHTACVQALLQAGARVNKSSPPEWSPLMYAASEGHTATVQALLQAGATVDQARPSGMTALMFAARSGRTATVEALLGAGANCKLKGKEGKTALSLAIAKKRVGVIELLRAYGATD